MPPDVLLCNVELSVFQCCCCTWNGWGFFIVQGAVFSPCCLLMYNPILHKQAKHNIAVYMHRQSSANYSLAEKFWVLSVCDGTIIHVHCTLWNTCTLNIIHLFALVNHYFINYSMPYILFYHYSYTWSWILLNFLVYKLSYGYT